MTLTDLLDEVGRVRLRDRSDQIAGVGDSLWPDEVLVRYLNAAQDDFCRKTYAVKAFIDIPYVAGTAVYSLPSEIIRVMSAFDAAAPATEMWYPAANRVARSTTSGMPRVVTTGDATGTIRLYPNPIEDGTLTLFCAVTPARLDINDPEATIDVPARYHEALVEYATYRALLSRDVDGGSASDAAGAKALYDDMVNQAIVEIARASAGNVRTNVTPWA